MSEQSVYTQVWHAVNAGEDGTFGPESGATDGYFVGGFRDSYLIDTKADPSTWHKATEQAFRDFINQSLAAGSNIGLWTNEGWQYMDESRWFGSLELAAKVAQANEELAIWDVANETEVYVGMRNQFGDYVKIV